MAFALVQQKTAVSTVSGTAISCTFDAAPTEGNLIMGLVFVTGTTLLPDCNWAGNHWWRDWEACMVTHYPLIAEVGQTAVFSVTSPVSVTWAVCLVEYSNDGMILDDTVDFENFTTTGQLSYSLATNGNAFSETGAAGISFSEDLVIVSFGHQGAARSISSWSGGFTGLAALVPAGTTPGTFGVAHQILTTTGVSQTATVTMSAVSTTVPAMLIQSFTCWPGPSRSRASQQSSPAGW